MRQTDRASMMSDPVTVTERLVRSGEDVIDAGMTSLSVAISKGDKTAATTLMRAIRAAVKTRHHWWMSYPDRRDLRAKVLAAIAREATLLRRCQAIVNFMPVRA